MGVLSSPGDRSNLGKVLALTLLLRTSSLTDGSFLSLYTMASTLLRFFFSFLGGGVGFAALSDIVGQFGRVHIVYIGVQDLAQFNGLDYIISDIDIAERG